MKRVASILLVFLSLLPLASALSISPAHEAEVMAAFQTVISSQDQRYTLYEHALAGAQAFADAPGEQTLSRAKALCASAIEEIGSLPLPSPVLSGDAQAELSDMGRAEDFYAPFDAEPSYRLSTIGSLQTVASLLLSSASQPERIGDVAEINLRLLACDRKIEYLCMNEFINAFSTAGTQPFRDDFLPTLTVFCKDRLPWGTDADVLEAMVEEVFSQYEGLLTQYEQIIGAMYADLMNMRADTVKLMKEYGYTQEQIDACLGD
jgi:hypothetical protein